MNDYSVCNNIIMIPPDCLHLFQAVTIRTPLWGCLKSPNCRPRPQPLDYYKLLLGSVFDFWKHKKVADFGWIFQRKNLKLLWHYVNLHYHDAKRDSMSSILDVTSSTPTRLELCTHRYTNAP